MAQQSKIEYSKEYLTSEELAAISKVKLPLSRQRKARDIFLFSCYTGMAYSDINRLRKENILAHSREKRFLRFHVSKSTLLYSFPLLDAPYDILKKYRGLQENGELLPVLPLPAINYDVQNVCAAAGIKKSVTLSCARKTFAFVVAPENGITASMLTGIYNEYNR